MKGIDVSTLQGVIDWQTAVRRGETKLPFEEWKKEQGK